MTRACLAPIDTCLGRWAGLGASDSGQHTSSQESTDEGIATRSSIALILAAAVTISLATTAFPVFDQATQDFYADSPDSVGIIVRAEEATVGEALRWWYGPWIQGTPYYRPLSSWVMWLEYLVAGRNFQAFCVFSWLLHALNGALLALLALRLFKERPLAWLWALLAVVLFNYRLGPTGPSWQPVPVAIGVVVWWPAQTDQLSLAFSLGSLLLLDRYLSKGRRRDLALCFVFYAAALLSKEMAVCLPLVVGLWVLYRRAREQWLIPVAQAVMAVALLVLRLFVVPGAQGPTMADLMPLQVVRKLLWYTGERLWSYVTPAGAGEYWLVVASLVVIALFYLLWRLKVSVVWMILTALLVPGLVAQILGGHFALVTIPREIYGLLVALLMPLGIIVLLRLGTRLSWYLLGMVLAVHLPILHVLGPHYWYWPAAFWGLFGACLASLAGERLAWVIRRPPFAASASCEGGGSQAG